MAICLFGYLSACQFKKKSAWLFFFLILSSRMPERMFLYTFQWLLYINCMDKSHRLTQIIQSAVWYCKKHNLWKLYWVWNVIGVILLPWGYHPYLMGVLPVFNLWLFLVLVMHTYTGQWVEVLQFKEVLSQNCSASWYVQQQPWLRAVMRSHSLY